MLKWISKSIKKKSLQTFSVFFYFHSYLSSPIIYCSYFQWAQILYGMTFHKSERYSGKIYFLSLSLLHPFLYFIIHLSSTLLVLSCIHNMQSSCSKYFRVFFVFFCCFFPEILFLLNAALLRDTIVLVQLHFPSFPLSFQLSKFIKILPLSYHISCNNIPDLVQK